jgi:hypothetical protein
MRSFFFVLFQLLQWRYGKAAGLLSRKAARLNACGVSPSYIHHKARLL